MEKSSSDILITSDIVTEYLDGLTKTIKNSGSARSIFEPRMSRKQRKQKYSV